MIRTQSRPVHLALRRGCAPSHQSPFPCRTARAGSCGAASRGARTARSDIPQTRPQRDLYRKQEEGRARVGRNGAVCGVTRGGELRSGSQSRHRLSRCPFPASRSRSALSATGADRGGQRDRLQVGRPGAPGECFFSPCWVWLSAFPLPVFFPRSIRTSPRRVVCALRGWGAEGKLQHIGVTFFSHRRVREMFISGVLN